MHLRLNYLEPESTMELVLMELSTGHWWHLFLTKKLKSDSRANAN